MTTRTLDYQGYVSAQDPRTMPGSVPPPTITAPIQDIQTNYSGGTGNTANPGTSSDVGGQFGDIINLLKQYQQGGQTTLNQATNAQIFRGLSVPQGLEGASPNQQEAARSSSMESLQPTIGGARDLIAQAGNAIKDYQVAQAQARDDARAVINNILQSTDITALHNLKREDLDKLESQAGYPKGFLTEAVTYKQKQAALALQKSNSGGISSQAQNSEALDAYNLAGSILNSDLAPVTGTLQLRSHIPGTAAQYTAAQIKQLQGFLSLENRKKLKGSGAISDYESRVLEQAASSLNRNLSETDFRKELAKIRGILAAASGLPTTVKVTNKQGQSKVGPLDRQSINDAIAQGYQIEYQ